MPEGGPEIDDVYTLRSLRPTGEVAARLALVIGPAEEQEVGKGGVSTVCPMHNMTAVAPRARAVTAREPARSVPSDRRPVRAVVRRQE